MLYETEEEACRAWVRNFNSIPNALIERAYKDAPEELVLLAGGDLRCPRCGEEVSDRLPDDDVEETIDPEVREAFDDEQVWCSSCERVRDREDCSYGRDEQSYGWPAAWGWLMNPDDSCDEEWIRDNAEEVGNLGFLVYESDETGILLGFDAGGFDFYEAFWIPLYRARGLRWHKGAHEGKETTEAAP